jgi:hypothetical protein
LLRDGKIDDAAKLLAGVVKSFPPDKQWLTGEGNNELYTSPGISASGASTNLPPAVAGDLAVLNLARGEYESSLDLLLRADFWMDAAYVAERVLSPDELKVYVDRRFPGPTASATQASVDTFFTNSSKNKSIEPSAIRYLLARRLARLGRWKEALGYFPPEDQNLFTDYISAIRKGHDETLPASDRVQAFLAAAHIARENGMELLGTELEPDYHCYDGTFTDDHADDSERGKAQTLTAPSSDELARAKQNAPSDERRFHYRYIAADHAWSAAELMPDDQDQTAKTLYEAGCWLKDRDPKAADKFYKALVNRCPDTDLGKAAAALHWFPKSE